MRDFHPTRRLCVRIFRRPRTAPQRPYYWRTGRSVSFGVGPLGVMILAVWTRAEIDAFNRRNAP